MKKWLLLLLAMILCLGLAGCECDLPQDTFFSEEFLAQKSLAGMPVPNLANSRLGETNLYCNLTDEEYASYMTQLLSWLQGREDIYHFGAFFSRDMEAEMIPYDTYTFLPEDYEPTYTSHHFVFSTSEELSKDKWLVAPVRIQVLRGSGNVGLTDFTYNTEIHININSMGAAFDPCARGHSYGEGVEYPVPGESKGVVYQYCIYCGSSTQDRYIGGMDLHAYQVTLAEGLELIKRTDTSEGWRVKEKYAGSQLKLTTRKEAVVTVNGQVIPALGQDADGCWVYGFVMPQCDITVSVLPASQEETQ